METWTDENWDSWDEDNPEHMKRFFNHIRLHYLMRSEVAALKKCIQTPSKVSSDYLESIKMVKEEQDSPTWMLTFMVIVLLSFTVAGIYLIS